MNSEKPKRKMRYSVVEKAPMEGFVCNTFDTKEEAQQYIHRKPRFCLWTGAPLVLTIVEKQ